MEEYLDRGRGKCFLRRSEIADLVDAAVRLHHGIRYELKAWVVMSNHVHILFKVESVPMSVIVESWKRYTANKANRLLKRKGPFWAAGYFDRYMRNVEDERKVIRYIENNPAKSKLVLDPKQWGWSSAKFRDDYGRLCF